MFFPKEYCFLFLLLSYSTVTQSKVVGEHLTVIQKFVHVENDSSNKYIKSITIHESEKCLIPMYNNNEQPEDGKIVDKNEYKTHAFYTATSCKFAQWTTNKLYEFFNGSLLFYQPQFKHQRIYFQVYRPLFENSIKTLSYTLGYIERFINILYNFVHAYSTVSYYNDTSILKPLLSLKMKIHFISMRKKTDFIKSDKIVIQNILEEMNALQRFMSMNCKELITNAEKNPRFYGYWITSLDDELVGVDTIDEFLYKIRFINLELDSRLDCSIPKMLLENIVTMTLKDQLSLDVAYAKVKILDNQSVTIKVIWDKLIEFNDIESMFWYQDSVLKTIIKLLYLKIINILQNYDNLPEKINHMIEQIALEISKDKKSLPESFVSGFLILSQKYETKEVMKATFQDYFNSLSSVQFDTERRNSENQNKSNIFLRKCNLKSQVNSSKDLVLIEVEPNAQEIDDSNYLESLMIKIIQYFADFKCFKRSHQCLWDEHNHHYELLLDAELLQVPRQHREENQVSCVFVLDIYTLCHQAIVFISTDDLLIKTTNKNKIQYGRAWKVIFSISDYFLSIILTVKTITVNWDFNWMAYKIFILLINLQKWPENHVDSYHLERTLNMIMTELNEYGIKYCSSPASNFLLFNNINFVDFGNDKLIEKSISKFFKHTKTPNLKLSDTANTSTLQYLNVWELYSNFIQPSIVLKLYGDIIRFYWKGKSQTVADIYKDAMYSSLNFRKLYGLYDVYFKFFTAVVYYEMLEVLREKKITRIKEKFSKMKDKLPAFKPDFFPNELNDLVLDIITLLKFFDNYTPLNGMKEPPELNEKLLEIKNRINKQFSNYNIVFEKPTALFKIIKIGLVKLHISLFSEGAHKKINSELSDNLFNFNSNFSLLKNQKLNVPYFLLEKYNYID